MAGEGGSLDFPKPGKSTGEIVLVSPFFSCTFPDILGESGKKHLFSGFFVTELLESIAGDRPNTGDCDLPKEEGENVVVFSGFQSFPAERGRFVISGPRDAAWESN